MGNFQNIYAYFQNFSLKTKKVYSFELWKEVHKSITEKVHLKGPDQRDILIEKAKRINSIKRKSK